MIKHTRLQQLNVSGTQEFFLITGEVRGTAKEFRFVLFPWGALCCCGQPDLRNIVSTVILCDLRVKVDARD